MSKRTMPWRLQERVNHGDGWSDLVEAVVRRRLERDGWDEDDMRWKGLLADYKRDFHATLSAIEAAGYRVVPAKPTDEMLFAGVKSDADCPNIWCALNVYYMAMLAAAPKVKP